MRKWDRYLKFLGACVIASALTLGGVAFASSSAPVSPAAQDVIGGTSSGTNLSTTGGVHVTLVTLTLPAGSWVVSSQTTIVNFGPSDYFRCQITAGGVEIGSGTTMVGDPNLFGAQGPGVYVAGRGLIGWVTTKSSLSVSLNCWHDNDTPDGYGPPYVDGGAVLWAHKSRQLSSP
jgi:hypothetical protein